MTLNQRQSDNAHRRQILFLIIAALVAATLVAYEPIRYNGFIDFDDNVYITENPNVSGGITRDSVIWAFTNSWASNWHPITWLSHMLDCEIYGLNPLGHHITNLIIHTANGLLLFWVLRKTTGAMWRSGFVAAAFALHPIHVESVAWAAERKDVLSGLFWLLTMLAYVRYAKRPNFRRYALVLLAFVMGLMSKPMVVTLPLVLLLLDYWPLGRLIWGQNNAATVILEQRGASTTYQKASVWRLLVEKIPMFVLSAFSCVITLIAQGRGGAVMPLQAWPLHIRVINSLGCYLIYVVKILYPKGLAVLYPLPQKTLTNAALLTVMGAAVLLTSWGRGRRWVAAGLLSYLVTLAPVIGLVKVGWQIMADRYTYLPSIGVFIIIAWGAEEIFSKARYSRAILASGAAAALIAMAFMTRIQVGYWKDTPTLFERDLAVTRNNFIMHNNYARYLSRQERYEEAIRHYKETLRIRPAFPARSELCTALLMQERFDEAIDCYTTALQERNDWLDMHKMYNNLGSAYEHKGEVASAETNYRKALALKPDYEAARKNLARLLAKQTRMQGRQGQR